ncbi:hypothetical protein [Psychroserpens luteus]|uniref:Zinc-finger n=1 Tax=Psychroserpens luteus TaxID=1434066 RepID=A0ABW5ZZP8_9FLAO|nr:hypothetical protein [Psychroserpens luteus]
MLLKKIMDKMINSCKKTAELIDKKFLTPLSIKEKVQLYIHKSMCKTCAAYERQSKIIDNAVAKLFHSKPKIDTNLSKERKQNIMDKINKS